MVFVKNSLRLYDQFLNFNFNRNKSKDQQGSLNKTTSSKTVRTNMSISLFAYYDVSNRHQPELYPTLRMDVMLLVIPCLFMQYEKILMVWVRITRGWKPSEIRTQTINIVRIAWEQTGGNKFITQWTWILQQKLWKCRGKCLEKSSFYICHNVAISFEDIQAWLTTMRVVSIGIA